MKGFMKGFMEKKMDGTASDTLRRSERAEIRLYRLLGIRWFQKACFLLERIKHRKDGGTHSNYHIRQYSEKGIDRHRAYLYFNGLIHLVAILSLILCGIILLTFDDRPGVWKILIVVYIILNLYCIMLQRYNTLRIRGFRLRERERRERQIRRNAEKLRSVPEPEELREVSRQDLIWLQHMRQAIEQERDLVIAGEDAGRLRRLNRWRTLAGVRWCSSRGHQDLKPELPIYTKKDQRADWIWRRILHQKKKLLNSFAILTADRESEAAFMELFGEDSPARILEVADTFRHAGEADWSGYLKDAAEPDETGTGNVSQIEESLSYGKGLAILWERMKKGTETDPDLLDRLREIRLYAALPEVLYPKKKRPYLLVPSLVKTLRETGQIQLLEEMVQEGGAFAEGILLRLAVYGMLSAEEMHCPDELLIAAADRYRQQAAAYLKESAGVKSQILADNRIGVERTVRRINQWMKDKKDAGNGGNIHSMGYF